MNRKHKSTRATALAGVLQAAQRIFETEGCCPMHPLGHWWQEPGRGEAFPRINGLVVADATAGG